MADTIVRDASRQTVAECAQAQGVAGGRHLLRPRSLAPLCFAWAICTQQPAAQTVEPAVASRIAAVLAEKVERTSVQRKLAAGLRTEAAAAEAAAPVTVDIRADVTDTLLERIEELGGAVVNHHRKYRAIRARMPLSALEALAAEEGVQFIRPADRAITHGGVTDLPRMRPAPLGQAHEVVTTLADARTAGRSDSSEGVAAHDVRAAWARYGVNGAGVGIGVLSDGVDALEALQASGDLPAEVTVLPGQAGSGDEGTAMLEIVHDLAPGAHLYFANATDVGQAQFAANIEALCDAGADVIVDDVIYIGEAAFQDGIVAQGVNAATEAGCFHVSAAGNSGNLTNGTAGVWEGDYVAGSPLVVDGESVGAAHVFDGGLESNRIVQEGPYVVLQWADPLGASENDYDLFLVDADGAVVASSTNTQDGTQDPLEMLIPPPGLADGRLVVVQVSGADRYLRLEVVLGRLEAATAGATVGHNAAGAALGVAAVDVWTAVLDGRPFDGTESVETFSSDGPRRVFFESDGTPVTPGDFSTSGGRDLPKPDITAANRVTTATPGFSEFTGTSSAAPHAAAIAALMVEAAGGPGEVTVADLRRGMAASALDIEAPGHDRDSGAGIVMAPTAVAALLATPRNRPPVVSEALPDLVFELGDAPRTIELSGVFGDPDDDALRYGGISSDPERVEATFSGSALTVDPLGPGRLSLTLRATDPAGLSAVQVLAVLVRAGDRDYDLDDDGLIDVGTLAQLDAMRYDLDGDGNVDGQDWRPYYRAFSGRAPDMGCPRECSGYELTADLDFDTNGNGRPDEADAHWNEGAGWAPIGEFTGEGWAGFDFFGDPYTATFEGNGHRIANLFIDRPNQNGIGLFGYVGDFGGRTEIRRVRLPHSDVTGGEAVGALVGQSRNCSVLESEAHGVVSGRGIVGGLVGQCDVIGESHAAVRVTGTESGVGGLAGVASNIAGSFATGPVSGLEAVGGLAGYVDGRVASTYATGPVSGEGYRLESLGFFVCGLMGGVGGLVGNLCGHIFNSYATGPVQGKVATGGLVGTGSGVADVRQSYWDVETSGVWVGAGDDDLDDDGLLTGAESPTAGIVGLSTRALQERTGYGGIYSGWNFVPGPGGGTDAYWRFRGPSDYPALAVDRDGNGDATWEEFGYQLGSGPELSVESATGESRVALTWTPADTSAWPRPPEVTYTVTRWDGGTVETVAVGVAEPEFVDESVEVDRVYVYQVASVIGNGEPARSARVAARAGTANRPPRAVGVLPDRVIRIGEPPLRVELGSAFLDPDGDRLSYGASASSPAVATAELSGSRLTVRPARAGSTTVELTATDTGGSNTSATQRFAVTVWSADVVDYDLDDDGLIEIGSLAQLDAMRHDRDGSGAVETTSFGATGDADAYASAFPTPAPGMGCSFVHGGCGGYELVTDLDLDTNANGAADSGDAYWNGGAGWHPIGGDGSEVGHGGGIYRNSFSTVFEGNGHTIANLFISREGAPVAGLFGSASGGASIRNVGLTGANVHGGYNVGILVGRGRVTVAGSHAAGRVSGTQGAIGGLLGSSSGRVVGSYSSAVVSGTGDAGPFGIGGLVGENFFGTVAASYATGRVSGGWGLGGLVGSNVSRDATTGKVTASYSIAQVVPRPHGRGLVGTADSGPRATSYWDAETSEHTGQQGRTTDELQRPTGYRGIYQDWNLDLDGDGAADDPWHFGAAIHYPALTHDANGDARASWREFGYQLRRAPRLTLGGSRGVARVELTWTAADTRYWSPPPAITYAVLRRADGASEPVATGLTELEFQDSDVDPGTTYTYQVAVELGGGEATRSAETTVAVSPTAVRPPRAVGTPPDRTLAPGERVQLDAGDLFEDPERRTLVYSVVSSAPAVVAASLEDGTVNLDGASPGTATITVTAENTDGATTEQSFTVSVRVSFLVPLFPSAADATRQGFARVVNRGHIGGEVRVVAIDNAGTAFPPLTLTVAANETVHFNSGHLERGGEDRGLSGATGPGSGDWRLVVDAALDIEVLSYIRTVDGFLTAMHDLAPVTGAGHQVVTFNPGSNAAQVSELRLINPTDRGVRVTVRGVDDSGAAAADAVRLTVAARSARTVTAAELEADGLGDGTGKWRLLVASPSDVRVMSLLRSPGGHLANLSTAPEQGGVHHVPLFPSASDPLARQGFVRIVNGSDEGGVVRVRAFDDTERQYDEVTAALNPGQALQFNSGDFEDGNSDKGLSGSTGPGEGHWRFELSSDLEIGVFSYVRTAGGFLTALHDVAPVDGERHRVAIFNPGSNTAQVSRLRVINPEPQAARVTVRGVDDRGASPGTDVVFDVPARGARAFSAAELEAGSERFDGALGDGTGKWRLHVSADGAVLVMSVLESPTGHLTNLSTVPAEGVHARFDSP